LATFEHKKDAHGGSALTLCVYAHDPSTHGSALN
jgi:hypothetical protein